jgi:L-ascorbate metabolism protein UlaG (beta-lactamase superfamily)
LLPIGAYEPRWFMEPQHMNPAEAVEGFRLLRARQALGYHWGTFRLTDEGAARPAEELAHALSASGLEPVRFLAARPGQVLEHTAQGTASTLSHEPDAPT